LNFFLVSGRSRSRKLEKGQPPMHADGCAAVGVGRFAIGSGPDLGLSDPGNKMNQWE
jgi:hypothetical protein